MSPWAMATACVDLLSTSKTWMHACMAPRSRQAPLLLLLLAQLSAAVASSFSGYSYYSFPVFDGKATTDGVVVATNSSMLAPATFLFDAQLFPEFNQSEGFVLLSRPVALWRVAADADGVREEASFNTSFTVDLDDGGSDAVSFVVLLDSFPPLNIRNDRHGPRRGTNGTAVPVAAAAVTNATNGIATVEVGSVSSYGPRPPPGVGLNVTVTPNRSSSGANTSQLAVRIEYNAAAHRLSVYAHDTAAEDSPVNDTAALLFDAPLDLAGRLPAQAALVGFYASTVRDLVVGVHDWELTVDSLADGDVVGDGPRRHSTSSSSSWLVILLAVLGPVAAVAAVVVSVMVYLVVARRRAVDMEVQQCYRDYFARMTR
uniref:Legume lectin domain-containing protein n=1 Tax=Hordeum vulgare subsp. vulgare TaxID=112509 RepID=A0A8I6WFW3_HORVV